MQHDAVSVEMKAALSEYRVQLDPVALLHVREAQSALAAVTFPEIRSTPSGESLLLRRGSRTDHGPPVRGGATVRELLPAVVQVGGEDSGPLTAPGSSSGTARQPRPATV